MTKNYKESGVIEILKERYSDDTILLISTAIENVPSVRSVDSFYYDESFWIVTDLRTNYITEIQSNENVMISDGGHNRLCCKARVVGHPLDEKNLPIREVYMKVFHNWYKEVNNESLKTTCFIKATPYKGYVHKDKIGYKFDINADKVEIKAITHHIDVKLQPFW
jgi:AAA15 family ATPase/GTPase